MSCFPSPTLYSSRMMTKRSIVSLLAFVFAAHTFADVAPTDGFNKYKIIIEKSPFKKGAAPTPLTGNTTVDSLMLKGYVWGDGLKKVWITDTKTNRSHYVGE